MSNLAERLEALVARTHSAFSPENKDTPDEVTRQFVLICSALGLSGEAGEYTDLVKKTFEQGRNFDRDKAIKELGDVLYYAQLAAIGLGISLDDAVAACEQKLSRRYPQGFSSDASENRVDEIPYGSDA
jgi:NTP pyrophosphatase (non-canonical NTP hydrolase)